MCASVEDLSAKRKLIPPAVPVEAIAFTRCRATREWAVFRAPTLREALDDAKDIHSWRKGRWCVEATQVRSLAQQVFDDVLVHARCHLCTAPKPNRPQWSHYRGATLCDALAAAEEYVAHRKARETYLPAHEAARHPSLVARWQRLTRLIKPRTRTCCLGQCGHLVCGYLSTLEYELRFINQVKGCPLDPP